MTAALRPQDVQATFAATLVDEWARGGLGAVVVCPGSRSTPLALAFADHPGVDVHIHHDERSGAFLALGLALASGGRAVGVLTTSGTAAVELHPAVVEAHHAGVPLLVCTADRPAELRDVGAPQTIDQTALYGGAVRWFADPGVADMASSPQWRGFAARALAATAGPPAGPVHLNLPFREPLVGVPGELPTSRGDGPWVRVETGPGSGAGLPTEDRPSMPFMSGGAVGRLSAGSWTRAEHGAAPGAEVRIDRLVGRRGVVLAGHPGPAPSDLWSVAEALGWPVVPDPRSSVWAPSPVTILHLDAILRSDRAREVLGPEVILRLGAPPASRVVNEWCAGSGADEIVVMPAGMWSDPAGTAATVVPSHPATLVAALSAEADDAGPPEPGEWLTLWRSASDAAAAALREALGDLPAVPNEPAAARDTVAGLPDGARLVVSSSMPIRDVERYAAPRADVRVLANRGANGIDGVVSTAVGVALDGRSTGLLIGDLAFLHDSNGLLGVTERGIDLVVVVVDNDGGGIFSFLPQARSLAGDRFETLFGTPHGLDLVALAQAYGLPARTVEGDLAKAVTVAADEGGVQILVVRTDRAANVEVHRVLDDAIAAAVENALVSLSS